MSETPAASPEDTPPAGGDAPTLDDAVLTPEQLAEAQRYGKLNLICGLTGQIVDVAFLMVLAFVLGGQDGWLMRQVPAAGKPETLRLAMLGLLVMVLNMVVNFPFSFYGNYILEHQFKLSRLSLSGWIWREALRTVLNLVLGLSLLVGLYWLIWTVGGWWWLASAAATFLIGVVGVQLAPVLIMPMFHKIVRLDDPELMRRMVRLAEGTGLAIEGVYRMNLSVETVKANAMLAGLGRTRRVILGDTLLSNFSPDEIEVVMAHEVGHHVHRHLIKLIIIGAFFSAGAFWACDALMSVWIRFTEPTLMTPSGAIDYAHFPIHTLPMIMLIVTVLSTLLGPLPAAISRHFERQCDRYALMRTGMNGAFITAFRKLARLNKDDPAPNPVAVMLFHSHPPISERLAMAEVK